MYEPPEDGKIKKVQLNFDSEDELRLTGEEYIRAIEGIANTHRRNLQVRAETHISVVVTYTAIFIVIFGLLIGSAALLFYSDDSSRSWGSHIITSLIGFAAGALWPSVTNQRNNQPSSDEEL